MSLTMYIVGFVIFGLYIWLTIWNTNNGSKKTKNETISNYSDTMDMDGMGNFSRFPEETGVKIKRRGRAQREKEKML